MIRLLFFLLIFLFGCNNLQPKKIVAAVVSAKKEASEIGIKILEKGGNAFDAMIATDLALAVCYPSAGNIGGGGFMIYRTSDGQIGTLDYREKAPEKSNEDMFLDSDGNPTKTKRWQFRSPYFFRKVSDNDRNKEAQIFPKIHKIAPGALRKRFCWGGFWN